MKKITVVVLVWVALVSCIMSCSSEKPHVYTSSISNVANDEVGVRSETDVWTGLYFQKNNMPSKSCQVSGNSYTGSYKQSIVDKLNSYTTDIYEDERDIEFGLRSDNGNLAYINFMNAAFFDTEPYLDDVDNSYDYAIELSTGIAQNYVGNIQDYTMLTEEPVRRYKERDGKTYEITYYEVTFAKKINGYFSSDYIEVKVTSKGHLASVMLGDIHAFENRAIDFDISAVNKSIADKIDTTYQKSEYKVTDFNIMDQKIVLTPNGDICMYSEVSVDVIDNSDSEIKTGIAILTVIGKNSR